MSRFWVLLKLLLKNTYSGGDRRKKIAYGVAVCIAAVPMLAMMCYFIHVFALSARDSGLTMEFIVFLVTGVQITVVFFGLPSMMTYMFFSKDAEFLSSLPVRSGVVYAAKFVMVYLSELVISGAMLLPAMITYGVTIGVSPIFYVFAVVAVLFMPMLPLVVVSLLVFPLMYVVSFFKKRGTLAGVVLILLFAGVMAIYMSAVETLPDDGSIDTGITPLFEAIMKGMYTVLLPNKFIAEAMMTVGGVGRAVLNFVLFVLMNVGLLAVSIAMSSVFYRKGVTSQLETPMDTGSAHIQVIKSSVLRSYIAKEFKCLVRDTGFAFQSFSGIVLSPLLTVFMVRSMSMSSDAVGEMGELLAMTPDSLVTVGMVLMYNMLLLCGVNFCATAAITRENRAFYINKIIPIDYKLLIKCKLWFSNFVSLVGVVLVVVVLVAFRLLVPAYAIFVGVDLALLALGLNAMGLKRDLKKPKFGWNNSNEAIKNNFYMMVPMLVGLVLGFGNVIMGVCFSLLTYAWAPYVCCAISLIASGIVSILADKSLKRDGPALIEEIEA